MLTVTMMLKCSKACCKIMLSFSSEYYGNKSKWHFLFSPHHLHNIKWLEFCCHHRNAFFLHKHNNERVNGAKFTPLYLCPEGTPHLSQGTSGYHQKCKQLPTLLSGAVFHAPSHGVIRFVLIVSSKKS